MFFDVKENSESNKGHAHDNPWQDQKDSSAKFVNNHDGNTRGNDLKGRYYLDYRLDKNDKK